VTSALRVLVDATSIPRTRAGVGRYLEHLIPALDATAVDLVVAAQPGDAEWIAAAAPLARVIVPRWPVARRAVRLLWEQLALPRLAARERADVIFSPHYTMPLPTRRPVVVTFHDATFFSHPEVHTPTKSRFFRAWIRLSLRRAAGAVVPSRATADELVRWTGRRPRALEVAYHGVDAATFRLPTAAERSAAAARLGAPAWIAYLGTIEPRKNVPALVRAFAAVRSDPEVVARHPGLVLALAGGAGWESELDAAVAGSGAADAVRALGFVDDTTLPGLLGGSLVFAYPSLGEGFGMPVAEAMACGAAVLTTPLLSLPEVGGDVAAYTDPDEASIAAALRALLLDDGARLERAARGPERAAEFTWAASAARHVAAFERARSRR
jgi:glycosyltransferase involved in cell wall biosynthesis